MTLAWLWRPLAGAASALAGLRRSSRLAAASLAVSVTGIISADVIGREIAGHRILAS